MDKKTGLESSLTRSLLGCVLGLRGATGWTSLESYVDDLLDVGELQPNPGAAGTDMALSEMFKQLESPDVALLLNHESYARTIHAITVQRHRKQVSSEPVMDLFGVAQSPATWSTPFL